MEDPVAKNGDPNVNSHTPPMRENTPHSASQAPPDWLQQIDTLHQKKHKQDFELLQHNIVGYIADAQRQCTEMGLMLENGSAVLQQANSDDQISQRQALIGATAALRRTQQTLSNKLCEMETYITRSYLSINQLWDELERVRLLSLTDHYTGLPNRRAFLQKLENEMSRALRYQSRFSFALIDLDFFKSINDRYGHAGGDLVLNCYANEVLSEIRHHDIVARYGGEEFAVLFPNTGISGATSALSNLRDRALGMQCEVASGLRVTIPTFSAGVTSFIVGDTTEALIGRADDALYQAKKQGRNRIEVKKPLADMPLAT